MTTQKIEIMNPEDMVGDISSLINHTSSVSDKEKEWFSRTYFKEVLKQKHYGIALKSEAKTYVNYIGSQELLDSARYIVDWLFELQKRNPDQYGNLSNMTFHQAASKDLIKPDHIPSGATMAPRTLARSGAMVKGVSKG